MVSGLLREPHTFCSFAIQVRTCCEEFEDRKFVFNAPGVLEFQLASGCESYPVAVVLACSEGNVSPLKFHNNHAMGGNRRLMVFQETGLGPTRF